VGVPVIAQVAWSKVNPAGNVGFEVQLVGVPPPLAKVGVILALATSEIEYGDEGKVISAGFKTDQSTVIVIDLVRGVPN
jgi:hypothetical protein